jgi:hypothetical protein
VRLLKRLPSIISLSLLASAAILSGCKRAAPPGPSAAGAEHSSGLSAAALSEAEIRFGVSPKLDKRVTYQPDVIVMEHGAEAIRSQSADGFTWTIDANAEGASEIEPGKIVFATGRVVGRVFKVARKGNNLDVTLGPVELTDVIKEAHIDYNGAIDPAKMIVYVAPPRYPGTFLDRDAPDPAVADTASARQGVESSSIKVFAVSRNGDLRPLRSGPAENRPNVPCAASPVAAMQTVYFDGAAGNRRLGGCDQGSEYSAGSFLRVGATPSASVAADIAAILLNGFQIVPDVSKGLGATIIYPLTNGMKFVAHASLRLESPRFTFRLDISHGTLKTASVELVGVGGLDVGIEGGTGGDFKNVNQAFAIPVDISFPMPVVVPFAATFHQTILVQTMFTAKQAVIRANGEYKFGGTVTAGIVNGRASGTAPLFVKTSQNLANSVSGLSLGVNGLVIGYGGKFIVGIGAFGLVVGPYASVNISAGITRGSDLQTTTVGYTCRSSTLEMFMDYGVGMALPSWSVTAVNSFLSIFHAKPISATYGHSLARAPIKTLSDAVPSGCAEKPAA